MSNEKIVKLWEQLAQEADAVQFEQMPSVVIRDLPCPTGYRAQLCLKRIPVYHRSFEVKGRGWIQNTKTGEVQYETGEWVIEKSANTRLQKALGELSQLADYKAAMATKKAPVGDSVSLF